MNDTVTVEYNGAEYAATVVLLHAGDADGHGAQRLLWWFANPDKTGSIGVRIVENDLGSWEELAHGFLRFDGCLNVSMGTDCMLHFCEPTDYDLNAWVEAIYALGPEMPGWY